MNQRGGAALPRVMKSTLVLGHITSTPKNSQKQAQAKQNGSPLAVPYFFGQMKQGIKPSQNMSLPNLSKSFRSNKMSLDQSTLRIQTQTSIQPSTVVISTPKTANKSLVIEPQQIQEPERVQTPKIALISNVLEPSLKRQFNARQSLKAALPKIDQLQRADSKIEKQLQQFVLGENIPWDFIPRAARQKLYKLKPKIEIQERNSFNEKSIMFQRKILAHILSKRSTRRNTHYHRENVPSQKSIISNHQSSFMQNSIRLEPIRESKRLEEIIVNVFIDGQKIEDQCYNFVVQPRGHVENTQSERQNNNSALKQSQAKKTNIYGLVTKAMIHTKYHLVLIKRKPLKNQEMLDVSRVEDPTDQDQFISSKAVHRYNKYYIQNHLLKVLEKASMINIQRPDASWEEQMIELTLQQQSQISSQLSLDEHRIRTYESQILQKSVKFIDDLQGFLSDLLVDEQSFEKKVTYELDYIQIDLQQNLKGKYLPPLLGELDELTRIDLLEQYKETSLRQGVEIDPKTEIMEVDPQINRLMEDMSLRERSKQFSKVKKKYELILQGQYEVDIDIFLSSEIRHLIQTSLIIPNQSQKHIEFKQPLIETSISLKPKLSSIKSLVKHKTNELVIDAIVEDPPKRPSITSRFKTTETTNFQSEDVHNESRRNLRTRENKGSDLSPKNKLNRRQSRFDGSTYEFLNAFRQTYKEGGGTTQRTVSPSQMSVWIKKQKKDSKNKKSQKKEPAMDKFGLIFRNMVIQAESKKQSNTHQRVLRAIAEENAQYLEEILIEKSFIDFNKQDQDGNTYLIRAAQCGSISVIKFLLQNGASISLTNNLNESALSKALQYQNFEAADLLFEAMSVEQRSKNF